MLVTLDIVLNKNIYLSNQTCNRTGSQCVRSGSVSEFVQDESFVEHWNFLSCKAPCHHITLVSQTVNLKIECEDSKTCSNLVRVVEVVEQEMNLAYSSARHFTCLQLSYIKQIILELSYVVLVC